MKYIKPILSLAVVLAIIVSSMSNDLDQSTACHNVTIEYQDEVPDQVARGVARGLYDFKVGKGRPIRFEMRADRDRYRLEMGARNNVVGDNTREIYEVLARIWTDWYSPGKPIVVEFADGNGEVLATAEPVAPLGEICVHKGSYLFHSSNISEVEGIELLEQLEQSGVVESAAGCMVRVIRTDERYELSVPVEGDFESETFRESMLRDARIYQRSLFDGATTKVVCCKLNMVPVADDLTWIVEGLLPGQAEQQVDNIVVVHDGDVSEEVAVAVATRIPCRDADETESVITLNLSRRGMDYECQMTVKKGHVDGLGPSVEFWAREIFSELDGAKSLRMILVNDHKEQLLSHSVSAGNGEYKTFGGNRMLYPQDTPQSILDDVRRGMQSVGLFADEDGFVARLTKEEEVYVLQIVILAEEPETIDAIKSEMEGIGRAVASVAFPAGNFQLEMTGLDFEPLGDCVWRMDSESDVEAFAAEQVQGGATASTH